MMNDERTEVEKYLDRTIERLEEILDGNPWHVRDSVREFVGKLKATRARKEPNKQIKK